MTGLQTIPLDLIEPNPGQPRKHFDREGLEELTASLRTYGLLEPIIVRPTGDTYQIIAGERRWRAAHEAGLADLPAIVREDDDATAFELSMVENVVRADMNPVEEAQGYQRLLDNGMTVDDIAARLGKKKGTIENRLRLNRLAEPVAALVRTGQLDAYTGAQLAVLSHEGQYRFIRAFTSGECKVLGDEARLISAIRLDEGQVGAFDPTPDEVTAQRRTARAASVIDYLTVAARALEQAGALVEGSGDLARLGAVADSVRQQAARVAAAVHAERAAEVAKATRTS